MIAFGNFEGTFYRYIKLTEAQKNWKLPQNNLTQISKQTENL